MHGTTNVAVFKRGTDVDEPNITGSGRSVIFELVAVGYKVKGDELLRSLAAELETGDLGSCGVVPVGALVSLN